MPNKKEYETIFMLNFTSHLVGIPTTEYTQFHVYKNKTSIILFILLYRWSE